MLTKDWLEKLLDRVIKETRATSSSSPRSRSTRVVQINGHLPEPDGFGGQSGVKENKEKNKMN